jgi:hypothetical protein
LWARQTESITLDVPATTEQASLVSAVGDTMPIKAEAGNYRVTLPGARCYDECIIGGPPVLIVEEHEQPAPSAVTETTPESAVAAITPPPTPIIVARETVTPAPQPTATASPDEPASWLPEQPGIWFLAVGAIGMLGLFVASLVLLRRK